MAPSKIPTLSKAQEKSLYRKITDRQKKLYQLEKTSPSIRQWKLLRYAATRKLIRIDMCTPGREVKYTVLNAKDWKELLHRQASPSSISPRYKQWILQQLKAVSPCNCESVGPCECDFGDVDLCNCGLFEPCKCDIDTCDNVICDCGPEDGCTICVTPTPPLCSCAPGTCNCE